MDENSRVFKGVLCIEDDEHPLVELVEELLQGILQVHLAPGINFYNQIIAHKKKTHFALPVVILLQILEEVDEDVRVPLVDDAVRPREQLVELQLRVGQEVDEELCNEFI